MENWENKLVASPFRGQKRVRNVPKPCNLYFLIFTFHLCKRHHNQTSPSQPQTSRGPRAVEAINLLRGGIGHYIIELTSSDAKRHEGLNGCFKNTQFIIISMIVPWATEKLEFGWSYHLQHDHPEFGQGKRSQPGCFRGITMQGFILKVWGPIPVLDSHWMWWFLNHWMSHLFQARISRKTDRKLSNFDQHHFAQIPYVVEAMKAPSESHWSRGWACLVSNHSKTVIQHCKQGRKSRKSQESSFHHALQNIAISNYKTNKIQPEKLPREPPLPVVFKSPILPSCHTYQSMAESQPKFVKWILAEEVAVAVGANMWKIYCLITYICNENLLKTSLTCVFLVKSKCDDTPISVLCNLLLSPTHHDAPAKIIMENLCSWLVSLLCCCPDPHEHNDHCVLPTLRCFGGFGTINFRPLFPDMVAGSLQLQAKKPRPQ